MQGCFDEFIKCGVINLVAFYGHFTILNLADGQNKYT